MDLDKLINEYLDCLKYERNYSNNTIASYRREIMHFKVYLVQEGICDYNDVDYLMLRGYLTKLYDENLAKSSINHRLSALRSFFDYLLKEEFNKDNPFKLIESQKVGQRNPDFLFQ